MVPRELVPWIAQHGLTELWEPVLHTTTAWIASASPVWGTESQRATACMDLGTCFFLLDDSPVEEALGRYDDLEHVATGGAPDPARPLQTGFASLFERLGAGTRPLGHYLALRVEFVRALRRRHALRAASTTPTAAEFLALREITIYFAPWLSTWEVVGGFVLSSAERALVAPAFGPANRWQVLENERMSVARDTRNGTPNLIALHAVEHGVPLAEAAQQVAERADAEHAAFVAASRTLRARTLSLAVASYLDALGAAVDGARRHHVGAADPARYAPT